MEMREVERAMSSSPARVRGLYRYPVKGLSPEALSEVDLGAGETVPLDRIYAIENGPGRFDPARPAHLPKINFLMLMRDERLATLATCYDGATGVLTVSRAGRPVAQGDLRSAVGRRIIEQFLAAYMAGSLRGPPKIVTAAGHSFSDMSVKCVHVVSLATVREVERVLARPLDPLRFRANLYLDGLAPWEEFGWLGKNLIVGGATLAVFDRTSRCEATGVDPATGRRDLAVPAALQRTWGHSDLGVYARVTGGGRIAIGDAAGLAG
jgi:uncharacterized protein YcbX